MFDTITLLAERDLLKEKLQDIKKIIENKEVGTYEEKVLFIKNVLNNLILD